MWLTTRLVTTFLYNLRSAVETIKHHTRSISKKLMCGKAHAGSCCAVDKCRLRPSLLVPNANKLGLCAQLFKNLREIPLIVGQKIGAHSVPIKEPGKKKTLLVDSEISCASDIGPLAY